MKFRKKITPLKKITRRVPPSLATLYNMYATVTFVIVLCYSNAFSQNYDSIKKASLENLMKLNNYYGDSIFRKMDQGKTPWFTLLPSVSYDLKNQSVNIGISLNSYTSFIQSKRRNKIELKKLRLQMDTKLKNEEEKTLQKIEEFEFLLQSLKENTEIFKITCDLFSINVGRYENKEITIEDFLLKKQSFVREKIQIKSKIKTLWRKNSELKRKHKIFFMDREIKKIEEKIINLSLTYSAKEINLGFLGQSPNSIKKKG